MPTRAVIRSQPTGPGGPFELTPAKVLGEEMPVFAKRLGSLRELLAQSAAHGEAEYLVHGDRRITYARHQRLVASAAHCLSEQYGIRKGDRVAILAANSPDWVIAYWATVSLGGIVAALNGWWTEDEIRYGLEHSEPSLLIGDRRRLERARGGARSDSPTQTHGVPTVEIESGFGALLEYAVDAPLPETPIDEDDPALLLYTSGTTGRPKGVLVSHRAILGFVQTTTCNGLERIMLAAAQGATPPAEAPPPPCALAWSG